MIDTQYPHTKLERWKDAHLKTELKCVQKPKIWPFNVLHWPYNSRPRLKKELDKDIPYICQHKKLKVLSKMLFVVYLLLLHIKGNLYGERPPGLMFNG